jgi:hypothetical protein
MTTIEQTRRELFRKIFANPPYEFSMARYMEDSTSWPGNYVSYHVECAWQAFNAALDAVVIDLQYAERTKEGGGISGTMWTHEVRDAIESTGLGLKVK